MRQTLKKTKKRKEKKEEREGRRAPRATSPSPSSCFPLVFLHTCTGPAQNPQVEPHTYRHAHETKIRCKRSGWNIVRRKSINRQNIHESSGGETCEKREIQRDEKSPGWHPVRTGIPVYRYGRRLRCTLFSYSFLSFRRSTSHH